MCFTEHAAVPTHVATNPCKEERCHMDHRGTKHALLEPTHPATALCFLLSCCRFLKSKSLEKTYWRLYRPTTGAFLLLTALHLCDRVRAWWFLHTALAGSRDKVTGQSRDVFNPA